MPSPGRRELRRPALLPRRSQGGQQARRHQGVGSRLVAVPPLLLVLTHEMIDSRPTFNRLALSLLGVAVDAFPADSLAGVVVDVQRSTADATGPLPASSATGEFQKVTQVVPVRIAIADTHGLALVPGMSATVRIVRD